MVFLGLIVPAWKLSSGPRTLQFLATLFHSFPEIFLVPRCVFQKLLSCQGKKRRTGPGPDHYQGQVPSQLWF